VSPDDECQDADRERQHSILINSSNVEVSCEAQRLNQKEVLVVKRIE
jgi:hypothetical protein